jgi:hypothetical protein
MNREMILYTRKNTWGAIIKRGLKDLLSIPKPERIDYNTTKVGVHTSITKYKNKSIIQVIHSIH